MDNNSRLKIIESLDAYLSEKKKLLSDICHDLGWNEESLNDEVSFFFSIIFFTFLIFANKFASFNNFLHSLL